MTYPDVHMISYRRYGYRMIGAADRAALVRARYMGQSLDLTGSQYHRAGTSTTTGESTTYAPPPPPPRAPPAPPPRVIQLHLGPPPAPPPPVLPPAAVTVIRAAAIPPPVILAAPVQTLAQSNPVCDPCPQCPPSPTALHVGGGMLLGGLLMYVVGLATREMKKKKRR